MPAFSHTVSPDSLLPPAFAPASQQRDALLATREEIKALDAYVETARSSLSAIERALEKRLERLVFPFLKLPHEIISVIFVLCLPSDRFLKPSLASAPLLLTRVNRAFRDLAHSIPYLWSSLVWKLGPSLSESLGLEWLSRASTLELSVAFESSIANPILPSGQRFSDIMSRVHDLALEETLSVSVCDEITNKYAILSFLRMVRFREDCSLRQLVSGMPQLRVLQLVNLEGGLGSPDFPENLTTIRIDTKPDATMDAVDVWAVLTSCPQLMHLYVGEVEDESGGPDPWLNTARSFPRLQTLHFDAWKSADGGFFESLLVPNLTSFAVHYMMYEASILPMLQRSPNLRSIKGMVEVTLEVLAALPNVEYFHLDSEKFTNIFRLLHYTTRNPALLPRLDTLRLAPVEDDDYFERSSQPREDWPEEMHEYDSERMVDLWAVWNLIQTRPTLRSVHVYLAHEPELEGELEARFRELVGQGLDLALLGETRKDWDRKESHWERWNRELWG